MQKVVLTSVMAYTASAFGAGGADHAAAAHEGEAGDNLMMRGAPMLGATNPMARGAPMGATAMSSPGITFADEEPTTYGGSNNNPEVYGGGGPVTCASGYDFAGPGLYCIDDNLYQCNSPGARATMHQNCGNGCHRAAAGQADYCNGNNYPTQRPYYPTGRAPSPRPYSRPTPRPYYPTPRPYSPSPRPAGGSNCDGQRDCQSCLNTPSGHACLWDPNWNKCRPENECDYTYTPDQPTGYSSPADNPDMTTACYRRVDQCFTGSGGQIDKNPGADSCTRVDNCYECADTNGCVFDTGRNLCVSPIPGKPCFAPNCIQNDRRKCN